nr:MAG TPA: hypothetical protein [Caudoviricetes sp.]
MREDLIGGLDLHSFPSEKQFRLYLIIPFEALLYSQHLF